MAGYYFSPQAPENHSLPRKLVLIFLLVTALALGLTILYTEKPGYPAWMQDGLAASSIAIAAALGSRFTLKRRNPLIRFLAASAALVVGLLLLGWASGWKYGIGPVRFLSRTWDWDAIAQIGLGLYLVLLAFAAWRRRAPRPTEIYTPSPKQIEPMLRDLRPEPPVIAPAPRPARSSHRRLPSPAVEVKPAPAAKVAAVAEPALKVKRAARSRKTGMVRTISAADLPVKPKRRGRQKAKVQFAVVEEHRCPYCLDPVSRADPRGVVECDVCHALHHKDCWDITGFCQVPHLNS
jgi:hypothetical protein